MSAGTVGAAIVRFTCTNALARKAQFLEVAATADYRDVGRFYADPRPIAPIAPPAPAQPSPAAGAISDRAMQAGQRYKACALAAARRFARSGETAPVVADAALAECASNRRALATAFAADPAFRSGTVEIAMATFDQLLRQQAQLEVVQSKVRR